MKQDQIEKILEKWGETKEPDHNGNLLPVLVALGYNIGQQWANNQQRDDLLARFEEFYDDWTGDQLTTQRYKMLHEELAPASIIAEMSDMLSRALVDPRIAEAMLENFHLFEKGIIWGLMSAIRNIIAGTSRHLQGKGKEEIGNRKGERGNREEDRENRIEEIRKRGQGRE